MKISKYYKVETRTPKISNKRISNTVVLSNTVGVVTPTTYLRLYSK